VPVHTDAATISAYKAVAAKKEIEKGKELDKAAAKKLLGG
jgi:hypothetical protein